MADTFFDIDTIAGLTEQQAQERLAREGYNELPSSRRRSVWAIALEVVREPMFLLLVACGVVYLTLGNPKEALMLLGFVAVIMGITIVQERRTERALEALRDLSSPRALVVRGGVQNRISGREVVRGDMIILTEGDRVPADAVVRQGIGLTTDESLLTGESVPVRKIARTLGDALDRPGGDGLASVFCGSLITGGQGAAEVVAVAAATQMGQIGKALQSIEPQRSLLQRETARLVRTLAVVGLSLCGVVVLAFALTRGGGAEMWKQGLLAGLTLAMATLPEEFPVVLTIFLAMGAWRISRHGVLTRRTAAVETLGATTVLCVDKTGTLTQNRMSIRKLWAAEHVFDIEQSPKGLLPERFHRLAEFGVLASKKDPFDPMDKALKALGQEYLARTEHLHEGWRLVHEYPLSSELLALSHVWTSPDARRVMIAAKGAPEAIADLCHMDDDHRHQLAGKVAAMADEGLRVLGVARGLPHDPSDLPGQQHDFDFQFLGLVGLADPVRPAAATAIAHCRDAGIRVMMITGDYPGTAANVARQIGLDTGEILTGSQLDEMSDAELQRRIAGVGVVARVVPQQKLRIVEALKANGEVVAMTGDGVNDAPALKAAHIGLAMGGRGTDVAREAASLVLLDDDFASIVEAVRLGRRIFDNIRKAVAYIFAIHVPIAGLSLIPVFFADWKLILWPVHIVFLELIIDPACTMVFEAEGAEPDVMSRRPRDPKEPLFSWRTLGLSMLQGLVVLAIVLGVFIVARWMGHSEENARGLTFAALVVANVSLILTNRSWSRTVFAMFKVPNRAVWLVIAGATTCLALVLLLPPLQQLFHFAPPHPYDLLICLAAGALSILWFEALKILRRAKPKP